MTGKPETDALVALDRAVRPLRRVLARGAAARAGQDPYFATSCVRLAAALGDVVLPPPFDEGLADVVAELQGLEALPGEERAERVARAGHKLQRLDTVLGLPLPERETAPRRKLRRVRLPDEAPPVPQARSGRSHAGRPSSRPAPAPEAEVEAALVVEPEASVLQGARWDTALEDLPLAEGLIDAAASVGLETVWDVLTLRPDHTESLPVLHEIGPESPAGRVAFGGRVRRRVTSIAADGARSSTVILAGAERLAVAWRRPFTAADLLLLPPGEKVVVVGEAVVDASGGRLTGGELARAEHQRATVVRYGVGEAESAVDDIVQVLVRDLARLEDPLPARVRERRALAELGAVLTRVHGKGPDEEARRRLAFDEALALQLGTSFPRFDGARERGVAHVIAHVPLADLQARDGLGPLSDGAQIALEAIKRDLRATSPMQRVLAGSSGVGVDDVALQAILCTAEGKNQVLVVAPEAPHAAVLYDRWEATLRAAGLQPALLAGEPRAADQDALRRGEIHVAFTTLATVGGALEFRRLGLVIAYEAHTYGETRPWWAALKSPRPDLLVVVRTALPGTTVLGAWPGFDVSLLPAVERCAKGSTWSESEREPAYRALATAIREGKPGVLVFPLRRQGVDLLSLREVEALIGSLGAQFFEGARVVPFHGAQSPRERQSAWLDLVEKRAQLLVATFPVEQLPVLPRATVAVVEYADRIDLQRLLALREIVTPEGHVHYVHSAELDPAGVAQVRDLADGLPDADVACRNAASYVAPAGPLPDDAFVWLDPVRDVGPLVEAREEAHALLVADPALRQGHGPRVLRVAHAAWARFAPEATPTLPPAGGAAQAGPAGAGSKKRRRRKRRR